MEISVRPMKKALTIITLIVAAMFVSSSASADPADYQPDGMGQLFQTPDMQQGQQPTLFEKYPGFSYRTDWNSTGWTSVRGNSVGPVLNAVVNVGLGATQGIVRTAIAFSYHMSDFTLFQDISNGISQMIGAATNSVYQDLFLTFLVVGAVVVFYLAAIRHNSGAIGQMFTFVWAGVAATSLAMAPGLWTGTVVNLADAGGSINSAAVQAAVSDLDVPIQGPTPTFGTDEGDNAQRRMADAIWRTYVVYPWCMTEFGSLNACKDYGEKILAMDTDERIDYIDSDEFKDAMGGADSDAWQMVTGQMGAERLSLVLPAILSAFIFCAFIIVLNAMIAVFLLLAFILIGAGFFFLPCLMIPGITRQWGKEWFRRTLLFALMPFVGSLVVSLTMFVSLGVLSMSSDMGWSIMTVMNFLGAIAGVLALKHIREIMQVPGTGSQGMLGSIMATAMIGKKFLPRLPRRGGARRGSTPSGPRESGSGSSGYQPGSYTKTGSGALVRRAGPKSSVSANDPRMRSGRTNSLISYRNGTVMDPVKDQLAKHGLRAPSVEKDPTLRGSDRRQAYYHAKAGRAGKRFDRKLVKAEKRYEKIHTGTPNTPEIPRTANTPRRHLVPTGNKPSNGRQITRDRSGMSEVRDAQKETRRALFEAAQEKYAAENKARYGDQPRVSRRSNVTTGDRS